MDDSFNDNNGNNNSSFPNTNLSLSDLNLFHQNSNTDEDYDEELLSITNIKNKKKDINSILNNDEDSDPLYPNLPVKSNNLEKFNFSDSLVANPQPLPPPSSLLLLGDKSEPTLLRPNLVSFDSDTSLQQQQLQSPSSSSCSIDSSADLSITTHNPLNKVISPLNKKKPHIEELIDQAHHLNTYLDENMNKINKFRADLLNHEYNLSLAHNLKNTRDCTSSGKNRFYTSECSSTFELSESGIDNPQYQHDNSSKHLQSNLPDDRIDFYKNENPSNRSMCSSNAATDSTNNNIDENENEDFDYFKKFGNLTTTYPLSENLSIIDLTAKNENDTLRNSPVSASKQILNETILLAEISSEQAFNIFLDIIECLLKLPYNNDDNVGKKHLTLFNNVFKMKSAASLSYRDFILQRIQPRCQFSSTIYLTSAYLLLTLLMSNSFNDNNDDNNNNNRELKFPFTNQHVHKLIIPSLRISCKLVEDHIHSQQYFSKVVGVSLKTLTKLEMSFLECLDFNGLLINGAKLKSVLRLHKALKENQPF
ncbi:uncharacterized protein SCODWIG_01089 [Saccharomycodes ludwigii]|uniref:Uncharacterized protein n=1 Tax=Saccharomycodes ludwigii TaxID=36035 RepID=A0A376B3R8_9ASCO|nr:hypothetical protein SCDLUD_001123 [Saccharomycodes ludwigii]KAH3903483.1 hypothetical protein SCDLUD_001123 [Saccharomycodes ludwigii]SSD59328.1 uncharacterized protein SCODWIG_01089 [Saccharomycodes ludwigii]